MNAIIELINRLLAWLDRADKRRTQKKIQRSRDDLEANPSKWFGDHFGGVRNVQDREDQPSNTDSKPNKS